jgi:hypothetical protein
MDATAILDYFAPLEVARRSEQGDGSIASNIWSGDWLSEAAQIYCEGDDAMPGFNRRRDCECRRLRSVSLGNATTVVGSAADLGLFCISQENREISTEQYATYTGEGVTGVWTRGFGTAVMVESLPREVTASFMD